ncbi:uncharacterized protein BO97DRAFT_270950 [Aspergillus homomorphus CBS 101889]|uniref:Uncharacterized protein n=1 Tax=Aspergillus homomorphus (strain CBS 101889) TaxID=1450537 RepID=A0A395I2R4_ASPHC|nr:hypothetical protein BO97DRAFT_270950 [Aspergillus homomorphus CBS 101889]RAL14471.1 hypothetical protein BO97DRAFT_270950 [Aspergillus homomorphus CBS 101889]
MNCRTKAPFRQSRVYTQAWLEDGTKIRTSEEPRSAFARSSRYARAHLVAQILRARNFRWSKGQMSYLSPPQRNRTEKNASTHLAWAVGDSPLPNLRQAGVKPPYTGSHLALAWPLTFFSRPDVACPKPPGVRGGLNYTRPRSIPACYYTE